MYLGAGALLNTVFEIGTLMNVAFAAALPWIMSVTAAGGLLTWLGFSAMTGSFSQGFRDLVVTMQMLFDGVALVVYHIWRSAAYIVDMLQGMFMMLAGIDRPYGTWGNRDNNAVVDEMDYRALTDSGGEDFISMIITSRPVQIVFMNLFIIAIILLLFFTLLQIIREQYQKKDGGNPYMIVFRAVKGLVTMLFVTAAVLVGLIVSGYVLRALEAATGRDPGVRISAVIFRGMAYNANRVRLGESVDEFKMPLYNMIPNHDFRRENEAWVVIKRDTARTVYENVYSPRISLNSPSADLRAAMSAVVDWGGQCVSGMPVGYCRPAARKSAATLMYPQ